MKDNNSIKKDSTGEPLLFVNRKGQHVKLKVFGEEAREPFYTVVKTLSGRGMSFGLAELGENIGGEQVQVIDVGQSYLTLSQLDREKLAQIPFDPAFINPFATVKEGT